LDSGSTREHAEADEVAEFFGQVALQDHLAG